MKQHPMAGKPMKITTGSMKGTYFIVIDWLVRQFQGKQIEKIHKAHADLTKPVLRRGYELDDQYVFGRVYPEMRFACVHDSELHSAESAELTGPNVVSLAAKRQEKANDAGQANKRDNSITTTGEPGPTDGRSVSSADSTTEDEGQAEGEGQADSSIGGTAGGSVTGEASSDKRKATPRTRTTTDNRGKGKK